MAFFRFQWFWMDEEVQKLTLILLFSIKFETKHHDFT